MGGSVRWCGRWVGGWMAEGVRGYGCLTCFVLLFSGPMVPPISRPLLPLDDICGTAVIHGGWVDRYVGVTVVLGSAVLL